MLLSTLYQHNKLYLQCLTPPKCWCHSVFSFCGFVRGRPTFDLLTSASVVAGGLVCGSTVIVDTTAGNSDVIGVRLPAELELVETAAVAWLTWGWVGSTELQLPRGSELEVRVTGTLPGEEDTCCWEGIFQWVMQIMLEMKKLPHPQ